MRQELVDLYAAMFIAKVKEYVYGDPYFAMMTHLEDTLTKDEYLAAQAQIDKHFGIEPLYK